MLRKLVHILTLYFAIDRRAVFAFFNPFKTEQFTANYMATVTSLRADDQHSTKCLRSIYFVLLFQSILQVYLYLFPFQWHRFALFDLANQSNSYPNSFRLSLTAVFLMSAYMFHMLYVRISPEACFKLVSDYYLYDNKKFVNTPPWVINKLVIMILSIYQVISMGTGMHLGAFLQKFNFKKFRILCP